MRAQAEQRARARLSEEVQTPDNRPGRSGYMPSVTIQGKLYHKIGPLEHDPDNPQWPRSFAQLYVHDPALDEASANDDSRRVLAISNGRVTPAGSRRIAFWLFSVRCRR